MFGTVCWPVNSFTAAYILDPPALRIVSKVSMEENEEGVEAGRTSSIDIHGMIIHAFHFEERFCGGAVRTGHLSEDEDFVAIDEGLDF